MSMPPSTSLFFTALTSSAVNTRSPMTIAWSPIFWNASQDPSASAGLISTPSSTTLRSLRGRPTRYTPPGISDPDLPRDQGHCHHHLPSHYVVVETAVLFGEGQLNPVSQ